jgi:hypothetical protein
MSTEAKTIPIVAPTSIVYPGNSGGSIINNMMPTFYISLIVIGVILLFATIGTASMDGLNGTIAGYSLMGGGILLLVSFLLYGISTSNEEKSAILGKNNRSSIMSAIYTAGPFLVLLGIIGYTLYLIITYKNRIALGNVAPGYVSFTNISIILILMQLFLFYMGSQKDSFKTTNRLDRVYSMLLYFIGIVNIVTIVTIGIILSYFSTDG